MIRAPFPWFGGKHRVADIVWRRFGSPDVYLEPFAGSLAVLLARPDRPRSEIANDLDQYVINFWRATQDDPHMVAQWADNLLHETQKTAVHLWLVNEGSKRLTKLDSDPSYYCAQTAGWWLYGIAIWIGGGFCAGGGNWKPDGDYTQGIQRQLPHLGPGRGVNRKVPGHTPGEPGFEAARSAWLIAMIQELRDRIRDVKFTCGDWKRITAPSITTGVGVTAVFLDPPYVTEGRTDNIYRHDAGTEVAAEVLAWAIADGENPRMRIALCGYEGDYELPDTWETVEWKAQGGYGNIGAEDSLGRENAHRERIWFSPHCLRATRPTMRSIFAAAAHPISEDTP